MLLSQLPGCLGLRLSTTVIAAAAITLIQGLVWMVLAVVALMIRDCSIDLPVTPEQPLSTRLTLILYFLDPVCHGDVSDLRPQGVQDDLTFVNGKLDVATASRTKTWASAYVATSFVWFAVSVFMIAAMIGRVPANIGLRACYPWIIVTAGTLVIDVVACVSYCLDANGFTTPEALVEVTNVKIPPSWFGELTSGAVPDYHPILVVGPLILLLILLRGVVVWLLDVVLLIHVIRAVSAMHKATSSQINDNSIEKKQRPEEKESHTNDHSELQRRRRQNEDWNDNFAAEVLDSEEFVEHNAGERRRITGMNPSVAPASASGPAPDPAPRKLGRTQSERIVGGGEWSVGQRPPGNMHGLLTRHFGPSATPSTPTPPASPAVEDVLRSEMPWTYLENPEEYYGAKDWSGVPHGKIVHNVALPAPSHPWHVPVASTDANPKRKLHRSLSGEQQWAGRDSKTVLY